MITHKVFNEVFNGLLKKFEKESDMVGKAIQHMHNEWHKTVEKYKKDGLQPTDIGPMANQVRVALSSHRKTAPSATSSATVTDNPTPGVIAKRAKDEERYGKLKKQAEARHKAQTEKKKAGPKAKKKGGKKA